MSKSVMMIGQIYKHCGDKTSSYVTEQAWRHKLLSDQFSLLAHWPSLLVTPATLDFPELKKQKQLVSADGITNHCKNLNKVWQF